MVITQEGFWISFKILNRRGRQNQRRKVPRRVSTRARQILRCWLAHIEDMDVFSGGAVSRGVDDFPANAL